MKNILIVEDDPIVSHVYLKRFRMEGWKVSLAASGEIALEVLQSTLPDLVVLDLQLPKVSGTEVLAFLRSQSAMKTLPVIVFSNGFLSDRVEAAARAGATLCFSKAVCTPKQLIDAVHSLLNGPPAAPPAPSSKPAAEAPVKPRAVKPAVADKAATAEKTAAVEKTAAAAAKPAPRRAPKGITAAMLSGTDVASRPVTPADEQFQGEVQRAFLGEAAQSIAALRHGLQAFVLNESDSTTTRWLADRSRILWEIYQTSHALSRQAGVAGFHAIARLASALEALLNELHERPEHVNPSTLRTISHAVDFLEVLAESGAKLTAPDADPTEGACVLAVDDEPISRRAVVAGVEKAGLQCTSLGDSLAAYDQLNAGSPADLVILDVDMPRMNGYELCVRLRALPAHARTPVVFVTSLSDFESCARSAISGGNDLIAKPILPIELAVKAIMYVMKSRLGRNDKAV